MVPTTNCLQQVTATEAITVYGGSQIIAFDGVRFLLVHLFKQR